MILTCLTDFHLYYVVKDEGNRVKDYEGARSNRNRLVSSSVYAMKVSTGSGSGKKSQRLGT